MSDDLSNYRTVLKHQCADLMSRSNVVATGVGFKVVNGQETNDLSIICSVVEKKPVSALSAAEIIPAQVQGVPTDIVETGVITAFQDPKDRLRPSPSGVSLGHFAITAGTLGCLVRKNGEWYILSNNHVIANSNDASIGDAILQPGPTDGGRNSADRIATLAEFIPINFPGGGSGGGTGGGDGGGGDGGGGGGGGGGCRFFGNSSGDNNNGPGGWTASEAPAVQVQAVDNLVDAAIARPTDQQIVKNEILNIGTIQGSAPGQLGMGVKKMGRTTGLTTGTIQQIDVTVSVSYGSAGVATFTDQLMAGAMSQGGDSGSAVLDNNNRIVGLLFAGSTTTTIINRIENVFSALGVSL